MEMVDQLTMSIEAQKVLDHPYGEPDGTPYLLFAETEVPRLPLYARRLYVLGIDHFNKTTDEQYPIALGTWQHFWSYVTAYGFRPWLLYEGAKRDVQSSNSIEKALQKYGDQGMFMKLAQLSGGNSNPIERPHSHIDNVNNIIEKFPPSLLAYFLYIRQAPQYLRALEEGLDLGPYHEYALHRMWVTNGLRSALVMVPKLGPLEQELTKAKLDQTHQSLFPGTPLDPAKPLPSGRKRSAEDYVSMIWPYGVVRNETNLSPLQHLSLDFGIMRSHAMSTTITGEWNFHDGLFCPVGTPHAVALGEILQDTLDVRVERYIGAAACQEFLSLEDRMTSALLKELDTPIHYPWE